MLKDAHQPKAHPCVEFWSLERIPNLSKPGGGRDEGAQNGHRDLNKRTLGYLKGWRI